MMLPAEAVQCQIPATVPDSCHRFRLQCTEAEAQLQCTDFPKEQHSYSILLCQMQKQRRYCLQMSLCACTVDVIVALLM